MSKTEEEKSKTLWERFLRPCLGDWNCLTFTGKERERGRRLYKTCPDELQVRCRKLHGRRLGHA